MAESLGPGWVPTLKRCSRCLLPETHETIVFDHEGVCNVCRQQEVKRGTVDWTAKEREFREIIEEHRGKSEYDCIVPFSGGKDSTFTLWYLMTYYKVKPLVVRFDHGFLRPTVIANTERAIRKLGASMLHYRPDWTVVRKLMLESLKRRGDFCWHCHTGIFAYPMQVAVKWRIPLIIWGEPSAEYTAYYGYDEDEEVDERRFNRFVNLGINAEDMVGFLDGAVSLRDLEPFRYPDVKSLRALRARSICLGSYIPWDVKRQVQIIKQELDWAEEEVEGVPAGYGYEKIECGMQGVRDYLKFMKRGYGRTAHLAAIDIRNGRLNREEGMQLVAENDGKRPASLDLFLKYVGISEPQFNQIVSSHEIAPYKHDPSKIQHGKKLWDQDQWDKDRGPA